MLAIFSLPITVEATAFENVVRVGWYDSGDDVAPESSSGAHGYDYEYLQALSQYTGWSYEYVSGTWDDCMTWLSEGKIDLLGFVSKTDEREKIFAYPNLPMAETSAWLVVKNGSEINSDTPISGMNIGLVKGNAHNASFDDYCLNNSYTVNRIMYDSLSDISPALKSGEIDAAVISDEELTMDEQGLIKLSSNSKYYVTNINNTKLLHELENGMMQVHSCLPYLNTDLYQKYFVVSTNNNLFFTADELEFIKNNPNILVMYDAGWPPIEYFDEKSGTYKGISPDLFALLSKKSGINFVYEGSTSGEILSTLESKDKKNVLTTISYDYMWAEKHDVYVTQPFISSTIVRLGKNLDAENPVVAINEKAYFTYAMAEQLKGVKTINFEKQSDRLEAVRTGKADYTYVTENQADYYLSMPKYSNLEIERMIGYEQKICISIEKTSEPELMSIISKCIANISRDESTAIIQNNTVNVYKWTFSDYLYAYRLQIISISTFLIVIIVAAVLFIFYITRNRTALQEAYEQKEAALVIAEQASEAKGSFMSRISHEIRTPLNAIIGYNTIARNEISGAKNETQRKNAEMKVMDCLTKSDIASRHLLTVINDVLDISAIESGKVVVSHDRFDFKSLITSLTTIFYSQAKTKNIDFEVIFDTLTEEWFVGDQLRVNQILTNLLSNAIKFTPEGGKVKLIIQQPEADINASHIHFEVSDNGIGMTPEFLSRIWNPFEQADPSISRRFGGTGLGMTITKNLVDLMGGTITVESKSGAGTTFAVDLTFGRTDQPNNAGTYSFSDINALVVDDDVSTCDYIRLLFERCGASCTTVTSGFDAVDVFSKAEQNGKKYTVCLVDWRMPKMDGIETIRRLRDIFGDDIPIIVLTAYDFTEIAEKAKDVGVAMFISKPLFQSSLFDLLANISGIRNKKAVENTLKCEFSGERVILAEDNMMNTEIAKQILESAGLAVDCACNGKEAVDMFTASANGTYTAILMDIHMPEMDGYMAASTIRSSTHPEAKTIPIVAMTADAFSEDVAKAHDAGMNDHVSKPIDVSVLYQTLKKYIKN